MQLYYCGPCLTGRDSICCQQVLKTNTFKSYRTGKMFKIFHQLNCKSSHLIYLLQCQTCQPQYVGKSEISFNIRLNNHWKDSKTKNPLLACKYLKNSNHNFQRDANSFAAVSRSKLGIDTFIIGNKNITTPTIELFKNVTIIHKY